MSSTRHGGYAFFAACVACALPLGRAHAERVQSTHKEVHQGRMIANKKPAAPVALPRFDLSTAPRLGGDPNDPREQKIAKLRDRLISLLAESPLSRSRVGVEVIQASNGDVLFAHNAGNQFNPASNTKILTTAAAMSYLGPDFRYHTGVYGPLPDANGVVRGDLVLRGSGDPSLTSTDVAEIARALAARGVKRIEGDLYADSRFHGRDEQPDNPGDGEGALILNRNTYSVHVHAGDLGKPASISVEPRVDLFDIQNQTSTVHGRRSKVRIDAMRKDDRFVLQVRGKVTSDYVDVRRLSNGALLAASVLRMALADFGVSISGRVRSGNLPSGNLLAEHVSALSDVCKISNKPSNNFVAEAIYKTLGGELYGIPGTLAKGTRAVADYLSHAGIKPGAYRIVNGSGLTHANRMTPADLASLLRRIYYDMSVAPEFLASLAVAGIDGTIRNRFLGTDAVGLVRAKTGTLDGVSALSGYVGDKDDVLIFSIFVEGFRERKKSEVRRAQVHMVEAMLKFLRSDGPGDRKGDELIPPEDYESDGDPLLTP